MVCQDFVVRHAGTEQIEQPFDGVAKAANARLSVAHGRVDGNARMQGVHVSSIPKQGGIRCSELISCYLMGHRRHFVPILLLCFQRHTPENQLARRRILLRDCLKRERQVWNFGQGNTEQLTILAIGNHQF